MDAFLFCRHNAVRHNAQRNEKRTFVKHSPHHGDDTESSQVWPPEVVRGPWSRRYEYTCKEHVSALLTSEVNQNSVTLYRLTWWLRSVIFLIERIINNQRYLPVTWFESSRYVKCHPFDSRIVLCRFHSTSNRSICSGSHILPVLIFIWHLAMQWSNQT